MLRQSLGLSLLTGIPFTMQNIRSGRKQPGLKAQHLTALNAAHQLSDAKITGNTLGSEEITFMPEEILEKKFSFDIGTAGSTSLFLEDTHEIALAIIQLHNLTIHNRISDLIHDTRLTRIVRCGEKRATKQA